jgi:DNA modification methylase
VDNQLGLERTPEEYVANMVAVFREVRRVLRDDGVLWLNLGDSYASTGETGRNDAGRSLRTERDDSRKAQAAAQAPRSERRRDRPEGLKQKDLVGIPWMVAFALRADGWYLRSDIIWAKPNPMPESVTDRPTKAHEYLFLLTKSERYYYDAAAIAEDLARPDLALVTRNRGTDSKGSNRDRNDTERRGVPYAPNGNRNARTVWTIATQPYAGAHFATFPEELARRCILAGSAAKACESCGAPWERVTEIVGHDKQRWKPGEDQAHAHKRRPSGGDPRHGATSAFNTGLVAIRETTGHAPTCACEANTGTAQSTVLDPFGGSGTVAAVATGHGRRAIYVDLNPEYLDLAEHRIGPMLCERAEPIVEDVA